MREYFSFLRHATQVGQSRSSITNPLQWGMGILLSGIAVLLVAGAPAWISVSVLVCFLLVFALYLASYSYFMFKNPDALRSEHYSLSKMAIERGLLGDSVYGLVQDVGEPSHENVTIESSSRPELEE